jgi:ribosomal protein L37AE/L43A
MSHSRIVASAAITEIHPASDRFRFVVIAARGISGGHGDAGRPIELRLDPGTQTSALFAALVGLAGQTGTTPGIGALTEEQALDLLSMLAGHFGWTYAVKTRTDAEEVLERRLTEEEWERVSYAKWWRDGVAEVMHSRGSESIDTGLLLNEGIELTSGEYACPNCGSSDWDFDVSNIAVCRACGHRWDERARHPEQSADDPGGENGAGAV